MPGRVVKKEQKKKKGLSEIRNSLYVHYNEMLKASQGYIFLLKSLSTAFLKLLEREDIKNNEEVSSEIKAQVVVLGNNAEKILNIIKDISTVANKILETKKDSKVISFVTNSGLDDIPTRLNELNIVNILNEQRAKLIEIKKQFEVVPAENKETVEKTAVPI